MKRRFRITTYHRATPGLKGISTPGRTLYHDAENTNAVRAAVARSGLGKNEHIGSITAIANVGEDAGVLS